MRPRRLSAATGDEGFSLVEVIVAIVIVVLVMVSAAPFMVSALNSVSGQSKRQTAAALADQALDLTRGVRTARLVQGRTAADVDALRTPGTTLVDLSQDDTTSQAAIAATTSAAATPVLVPTTVTRTVSNVPYQVKTFVEACWLDATTASGAQSTCGPVQVSGSRLEYRVTAEVVWPRHDETCRGPSTTTCSYDVTTLRDATPRTSGYLEPLFNTTVSSPTLSSRAPSGSLTAGSTVSVTVYGTGFQNGAEVTVSGTGTTGPTTVVSSSQATVSVTAAADPGTCELQLTNPDGGISNTLSVVVQ